MLDRRVERDKVLGEVDLGREHVLEVGALFQAFLVDGPHGSLLVLLLLIRPLRLLLHLIGEYHLHRCFMLPIHELRGRSGGDGAGIGIGEDNAEPVGRFEELGRVLLELLVGLDVPEVLELEDNVYFLLLFPALLDDALLLVGVVAGHAEVALDKRVLVEGLELGYVLSLEVLLALGLLVVSDFRPFLVLVSLLDLAIV